MSVKVCFLGWQKWELTNRRDDEQMDKTIIIIICIIALSTLAYWLLRKHRQGAAAKDESLITSDGALVAKDNETELKMVFDLLPSLSEEEEAALVEVKDSSLVAAVDNFLPKTVQTTEGIKAVQDYNEFVRSTGQLYEVIIPQGVELDQSRAMAGAVRGTFHGENGYAGAANWIAVDQSAAKRLAMANVTNGAMNAASMVVGQYYMSQIDRRLKGISADISKISLAEDTKYWGKVATLADEVQKVSAFNYEIIQNEETRKRQLDQLADHGHECAELLNQASIAIQKCSKKDTQDYTAYEAAIKEADKWYVRQTVLLEVADRIADLTFALGLGSTTRELCRASFDLSKNRAVEARRSLQAWHDQNCTKYAIDVDNERRERGGLIGKIFKSLSLDYQYRDISKSTAKMIGKQSTDIAVEAGERDLFKNDIRLIGKDGKLYYLPPSELKQ